MDDFMKFVKYVCYIVLFGPMVVGLLMVATGNGTKSSDSGWHSSRPYNSYQNRLKREQERARKKIEEKQAEEYRKLLNEIKRLPPKKRQYHTLTPYQILWNECEELADLLEDNDIDHEDMSYPMSYEELEELKDEYVDLLEENDIDYL